MSKSVSQDLASAKRRYEACISLIRSHCNCVTCRSKSMGHDAFEEEDDEDIPMTPVPEDDQTLDSPIGAESDEGNASDVGWDSNSFCELVITETIIFRSRMLSNVILEDKNLLPTRSGLERAYQRRMRNRLASSFGLSVLNDIGLIAFCMDFDNNFSFSDPEHFDEGVEIRLQGALELFAGREVPSMDASCSALCVNGICGFLDLLSDASLGGEDMDSASKIRILPGRIYREKKFYDMPIDHIRPSDPPDTGFQNASKLTYIHRPQLKIFLSVRETFTGLEAWIETEIDRGMDGREERKIWVGPSRLAALLTSRRGLVCCKRLPHTSSQITTSSLDKDCPWSAPMSLQKLRKAAAERKTIRFDDKAIDVLNFQDVSPAIAAIASTAYLHEWYSVYIVKKECLDCCLKAVLEVEKREASDFCVLRLPN